MVLSPVTAVAQSIYTPEMVRDLPSGANLFALIESAQPEVTTDRFNSGGLNGGDRDRASGFLASWTQTRYAIGDVPISSPIDGAPMLFPALAMFGPIHVSTATRGLEIDLRPLLKHAGWSGTVEAVGAGGALTQTSSTPHAPAISQLHNVAHVNGFISGSPRNRLELTAGGVFTRAATVERRGHRAHHTATAFASGAYSIDGSNTLLATIAVQPDAWHVQSTYDRAGRSRVFGGYTARVREPGRLPAFSQAERLSDGPIPSLIASRSVERRASAGWRIAHTYRRHSLSAGLEADRASSTTDPIADTVIAERVAGLAARVWRFTSPAARSRRHATIAAAFIDDRLAVTRTIAIDASLRFDTAHASATGAERGINWSTWLPAVHVGWTVGTPLRLRLRTGVSRHADYPLLEWLACCDPSAPTASVFAWDGGENVTPQPLIMRVGPGTGGDPAVSAIDRGLERPVTDQFMVQLTANPWTSFLFRVTGLARRQSSLIGVVNTGVPISGYTMFTIPDANADWVNPADDQQLPVYERKRDTFGQDRYLLTNPEVEAATMGAIVVSAEIQKPRVLFRIGGTASASVGPGGNRGFTAGENDPSVPGELFTNPNAQTYARGRLFNDRAYTIKSLAIVRLPSAITGGAVLRYQDGQPFSRLAIVPSLNQGAEAIQAFPRGRSRFTYRATVDVRLQKSLTLGNVFVDLIADAYNLLNQSNEVEEYVVTGPRFREITAVQPPRAFHLGARLSFD